MKRKTFYAIAGVILILMVGYFSYQVLSMAEVYCHASMTQECMQVMEECCNMYGGGSNLGFWAYHSFCYAEVCWTDWKVICENYIGNFHLVCGNDNSSQCQGL